MEKSNDDIKKQNDSKKEQKDNRGRKKKIFDKSYIQAIMKEVEDEMNSDKYKKIITLNEEKKSLILYKEIKDIPDLPNQYNKETSKMIMTYINNIRNKVMSIESKNKILEKMNVNHFLKNLIKIISCLNMNENELSVFTILLDRIGWDYGQFDQWEHLYYIGILTLQKLFNKYEDFEDDKYKSWIQQIITKEDILKGIGLREMNARNKELRMQTDIYFHNNYIDYNEIVDTIIDNAHLYNKSSNKDKDSNKDSKKVSNKSLLNKKRNKKEKKSK